MIDLIVPTVEGREESLERCLASFPDTNPIIVRNVPTCGIGWTEGIKRSSADYLILCADDIENTMGSYDACVETVDAGYLPAPIIHGPTGNLESAGGDMAAASNLLTDIQADWTPVDFTPMPFVSREQIKKIRMIPSHMQCDLWVSRRGRQLGYETVLRHDYTLNHHHLEVGRKRHTDADDSRIFQEAMNAV